MRDWQDAWQDALYGPDGFFTRGERPAAHFRTAPLVGPELAEALVELLARIDLALDRPSTLDFVDLGAGGGELASAVRELASGGLGHRLRVTAVELVKPILGDGVRWSRESPNGVTGLLVAHEWLDSLPCPVVTIHDGEIVRVAVDSDGVEQLGPHAGAAEVGWLHRWWPLSGEGDRAEVGAPRDAAWAGIVRRVRAGAALAIDYGHTMTERVSGRYSGGTLAAYRAGLRVRPVPDGSRDLTAHVAVDSGAAAAGGPATLNTQTEALAALGLAGGAPPVGLAATDPATWLAASARAGRIAELRDPNGLGAFWWLLNGVGGIDLKKLLPADFGHDPHSLDGR